MASTTPRMSFLGMGRMGKAMSKNLAVKAKLADPLILWNRTKSSATEHSTACGNTIVVETPQEAVRGSDIIWSCLYDDQAVKDTFHQVFGEHASLQGKLFVECSTIDIESTKALSKQVLDRGGEFVSMPVFGEPSMAAASVITCVPAGPTESVAKIKPYLVGVLGRAVIDFSGESPEKASLLKLIGNVFIINMISTLAEGHVLAEKCGLGTGNLEKFLEVVFPGPYMVHSKHMSSGRYHAGSPIGDVAMAKHVVSHVMGIADKCGSKLPLYEVSRRQLDVLESQRGSQADIDGLYGVIRTAGGLPFENN